MCDTGNVSGNFVGADGWLLAAIVLCKPHGTLSEIYGVADALNHALPSLKQLDGGLNRLLNAGLIIRDDARFIPTEEGKSLYERARSPKDGPIQTMLRLQAIVKRMQGSPSIARHIQITPEELASAKESYFAGLRRRK